MGLLSTFNSSVHQFISSSIKRTVVSLKMGLELLFTEWLSYNPMICLSLGYFTE